MASLFTKIFNIGKLIVFLRSSVQRGELEVHAGIEVGLLRGKVPNGSKKGS